MTSQRIIKSHLPFRYFEQQLNEQKTKVVLMVRNIKDTLVSLYHFYRSCKSLGNMKGSFDEFFELFKEKRLVYGDWFDHISGYLNNQNKFNLLVVKYEDLKNDLKGTIRRIAEFLEEDLSENQFHSIAEHVDFKSMQHNKSVNKSGSPTVDQTISPYMRKGVIGDWKNYFTEEQVKYIDTFYKEKTDALGIYFNFEN